jgi:hypothetical protein
VSVKKRWVGNRIALIWCSFEFASNREPPPPSHTRQPARGIGFDAAFRRMRDDALEEWLCSAKGTMKVGHLPIRHHVDGSSGNDLAKPPDRDRTQRDRGTGELQFELGISGNNPQRRRRSAVRASGRSAPPSTGLRHLELRMRACRIAPARIMDYVAAMGQITKFHWGVLSSTVLAVVACAEDPAPREQEDTSTVSVALTTVPSGILCINIKVTGSRSFAQKSTVSSGQSSANISIGTFPTGNVAVSAEAYTVACNSITTTTSPTWISDTANVFVSVGQPVTVSLTLRQVSVSGSVSVDFCSGTGCAPRVLATAADDIYDNIISLGGRVYFGNSEGLWSVPKAGGTAAPVWLPSGAGSWKCEGFATDGTNFYVGMIVSGSGARLMKVPVNGDAATVLRPDSSGCSWPQAAGSYVYFELGGDIGAVPKNDPTQLTYVQLDPALWQGGHYLVDGAKVLWFDPDAFYGFPVALPSDTTGPNTTPGALAVDETNYYVMFGNKLKMVPRNGTTVTTLVTVGSLAGVDYTEFGGIYLDGTQMYYSVNGWVGTRATTSELWRCAKPNCTSQTKIATFSTGGITRLAGDENSVYVAVGKQLIILSK